MAAAEGQKRREGRGLTHVRYSMSGGPSHAPKRWAACSCRAPRASTSTSCRQPGRSLSRLSALTGLRTLRLGGNGLAGLRPLFALGP